MSGNGDHFQGFIDSAWRSCSFLSKWICSSILRCCITLDGLTYRNLHFTPLEKRKSHRSTLMAASEPIDISSSDSDGDGEGSIEIDTSQFRRSSNSRVLPPEWANNGSNSRVSGYGRPSQGEPSPNLAYASSSNSLHVNNHSRMKGPMHHGYSDDVRDSSQIVLLDDDSDYFVGNGNMGQPWTVKSRIANGSGTDFETLSSYQAMKRTLPPSLQLSGSSSNPKKSVENASSNQIHDTHRHSYYPSGSSLATTYSRGTKDEVMLNENNRSRTLPPSLVHGKSVSSLQFNCLKDSMYRAGLGEERAAAADERLIYQAALEDLNQPKSEATLPDGLLSVPLLRHQKIALQWMLQKEMRSVHCLGGILADDQGLGKTVSVIALILMERYIQSNSKSEDICDHKTEALNLDDDEDDVNGSSGLDKSNQSGESCNVILMPVASTSTQSVGKRPSAGTLVVCPASVLRQWARELDDKVAEEAKMSVLVYHGGSRTKDPAELAKYDVVLTTYSIVTNEVPKRPLVDEEEADEKNGERFGLSSELSINKKRKPMCTTGKRGKKGRKNGDGSSIDSDCGPLARVGWLRVVLDEAQTIKNHRTQVARACCSLRAKRRWCLSGTPIQNAIDDLYSYFRFLRYEPYAMYKSFYNTIKLPISRNSITGYKKLQAVLRAIMLRRTKGTLIDGEPIIKLPPKLVNLTKVDFSPEERAFYSQLEADSRTQFKAYAAAGTVNQNYANILLMLLRLRQACDHPLLVKEYNSGSVNRNVSRDTAKRLPREMLVNLMNRLEISNAICLVCNDPPEDPVVTMCGHVFCYQCVSEYLTGDDNTCPAPRCREQLGDDVVFSKATLTSSISDDLNDSTMHSQLSERSVALQNEYSSKIRAVIEIILSECKFKSSSPEFPISTGCNGTSVSPGNTFTKTSHYDASVVKHTTVYSNSPVEGPIKAIVFSQWTSMLDLVETALNEYCIQYRRLDGTMSLASRDRAVKDFNTDPEVTVMLMSLKAGNLGLNMVAACHVILLDLWWNPTTEDQAVDRAHRIGQTRPVTVTRITIKNTVEDRILALQEEKRKMVASAFGEDQSGGSATRLTVEDLRYLFMS